MRSVRLNQTSSASVKQALSFKAKVSAMLRWPIAGPVFRLYAPHHRWSKTSSSSIPAVKRVLIANLMPSLGDTICYLPLLDVLASARPDIEVTWLANGRMSELLQQYPGLHRVISVNTPSSLLARIPTIKSYYHLWATMSAIYTIKPSERYDLAVVPRGGVDPSFSAHAVWMLNPGSSYGYSYKVEPGNINHNHGDCLLTHVDLIASEHHEAMRALMLLEVSATVRNIGQYWMEMLPIAGLQRMAAEWDARSLMHRLELDIETPLIVVSPGAGEKKKQWPPAKFRQICDSLREFIDCKVLITGTNAEERLCEEVCEGLGPYVRTVAGELSLPELVALLGRALLFVGNDSGAGHIAGALGIATVSLHVQPVDSNPNYISSPEHFRPVGPRVRVVQPNHLLHPCVGGCQADHAHCIDQITVEQVFAVILDSCERIGISAPAAQVR